MTRRPVVFLISTFPFSLETTEDKKETGRWRTLSERRERTRGERGKSKKEAGEKKRKKEDDRSPYSVSMKGYVFMRVAERR